MFGLIGDGSALYGIQGLWSAAHHRIPGTFVLCNNAQYQILKVGAAGLKLPERGRILITVKHSDKRHIVAEARTLSAMEQGLEMLRFNRY